MSSGAAPPPVVLSVAGSDSGGGAGIQADLKTWEALGVFGATAVTCVTAQSTSRVREVYALPVRLVRAQIEVVFDDLPVAAVKTGLLPSAEVASAIGEVLRARAVPQLVVDPVLTATTGDPLAGHDVPSAILSALVPVATLLTPNLEEASVLSGMAVRTVADMRAAAARLVGRGASAVLVKGGHLPGLAVDVLLDAAGYEEYAAPRLDVGVAHGTGCALSAAIAAGLARGLSLRESIGAAKHFVAAALRGSFALGSGARLLRHRREPGGA